MKPLLKPEDYSRDWARGVCMNVELTTGVQPRPRRIWPYVVGICGYVLLLGAVWGMAIVASVARP